MADDPIPVQPEERAGRRMLPVVIFTILISGLISMVIAILRLGKRGNAELASTYGGEFSSGPSFTTGPVKSGVIEPMSMQPYRSPQPSVHSTSRVPPGTPAKATPVDFTSPTSVPAPPYLDPTTRWSTPTKYVVGVGLFLAFLFILYISRSTLPMIIFAALLAFVVQPPIDFFQRRWKMKRGSAIGVAYLLVVAALIIIPLFIIPATVQAINNVLDINWAEQAQETAANLQAAAEKASALPIIGPSVSATLDAIAELMLDAVDDQPQEQVVVEVSPQDLEQQLANTLGRLAGILGPAISAFTSLIFMLLISLRISLAAHEMREAYPKLIPPAYKNESTALVERIINIWTSFLRGQLSLMVVMGFLTYLLNVLLGTPYPIFLGLLAGILEIIPNLGPVLATIPAVIFALMFGSSYLPISNVAFAILVIAGYISLSALENQVLVPKILGDAVDLHPLVVIVGCVIGGAAAGLLGVFLATPVISSGKEIFGYLYNKILEPKPAAEVVEEKPSMMDSLKGFTKRFRLPFQRHKKEEEALPEAPPTAAPEGTVS